MTTHLMKLNAGPFIKIKNGLKIYELRLFDEKRQQICVGDIIEFTNRDSFETCTVQVLELCRFESFEELYNTLPLNQIGYGTSELDTAAPSDMEKYYSKEEQSKYGVVAIKIKLL